ncbi:hypothetical protein [Micromonospora sp. NPDC048839]|uniref:hypothetical protein n=1 Tax=Micromonospora sp. NPDC048839 TaxID=3155641 RepID=UPI0033EEDB26
MAANAGTIIGRVSVKVMPDTSDFRRDAQKKLNAVEKELTADVKLVVDLEDNGVAEEAKAVRAKAQKQLKSITLQVDLENQQSLMKSLGQVRGQLDKLSEKPFPITLDKASLNSAIGFLEAKLEKVRHIDLEVDRSSMDSVKAAIAQIDKELGKLKDVKLPVKLDQQSLAKARAELELTMARQTKIKLAFDNKAAAEIRARIEAQLSDIPVNTKLDEAKIAKVMRQIEGYLDQIEHLRAKITPELDDRARRKVERDIEDLQDKIKDLKAEVKPETSKGAMALVTASLVKLTRDRIVNIFPVVDKGGAAAALAMINALSGARVLTGIFDTFMKSLANLDKAVPLIGSVTLAALGLAGATISAASNMASLAASLASIAPAALLLPGLFAGMALGLGATFVALKDFNAVLPGVKQQLSELADQMSSNFWSAAKAPISDLINNLLPAFSAGMKNVSTEVGQFFGQFATALQGAIGPSLLAQMFGNLTESIEIAKKSTGDLASIIGILGELGASYLPQLAQWFVDIVNKFEGWLAAAEADGRLKGWVDTAIVALGQLWTVLTQTASIFVSVAEAASMGGGATLGTLATGLTAIAQAAKDPVFQGQLAATFAAAHQMMENLANRSGPAVTNMLSTLATTLQSVLPAAGVAIGNLVSGLATALADPAIQQGLILMVEGISRGIASLAPVIQSLSPVFGMLGQIVGTFAAQLGPLIAAVLPTLSAAFMAILPSVQTLVTVLGGALLGVFQSLMPAIQPAIALLAELVPQLVSQLAPVLQLIGQLLGQLLAAIMPLIAPLLQLAMAILTPLIAIVKQVIAEAMGPFMEAINKLVAALQPVIAALTVVVGFLMSILGPAIAFIAGLLIDTLVMAIDGVARVFEGVVGVVLGIWNIFAGIFTGDWDRVWSGIKEVFSSIWNLIVGIVEVALSYMGGTAIKGGLKAIKGLWDDAWLAIKTLFESVWNGIKSFLDNGFTFYKNLFSSGLNFIKSLWDNTWNAIKNVASTVWEWIVAYFRGGIEAWKNLFRSGIDAAKSVWESGLNLIKNVVPQKFGEVLSFMKSVPGKIKDAFGAAKNILFEIGKSIIGGLIDGIKNMFGSVQDTLGGLTDKIKDWKGPESLDKVLLVRAGQLVIGGFIKGLESQYDQVRRSLAGLTADLGGMTIAGPSIGGVSSRGMADQLAGALGDASTEGPVVKQFIYNAAPGSSIDSQEDLFAAVGRARWGW